MFVLEYMIDADGYIEHGVFGRKLHATAEGARAAMKEAIDGLREQFMDEYDIKDFEGYDGEDRCSFSGDGRVSIEIEVVELKNADEG